MLALIIQTKYIWYTAPSTSMTILERFPNSLFISDLLNFFNFVQNPLVTYLSLSIGPIKFPDLKHFSLQNP